MVSWSKLTFKGAVQPTALSWTTCIAPRPELAPFLLFAAPHQFGSDRRRSGHSQRRICVFGRPVPFATVNPVNLNLAPGPGEVGRAARPHFGAAGSGAGYPAIADFCASRRVRGRSPLYF